MTTTASPSARADQPATLDRRQRSAMARRAAAHFDRYADERPEWRSRNHVYYDAIERLCRREVPPGARVLEIGCGVGDLLAATRPSFGVGVDVSRAMVDQARRRHTSNAALRFFCADAHDLPFGTGTAPFDYVICSDLLGHLADIQLALQSVRGVCAPHTKVIITYWNFAWQIPVLLAERLGAKMPQGTQNWLGMADVENLLRLSHFDVLTDGTQLLLPKPVPVLAPLLNDTLIRLPFLRLMGLSTYWIARPARSPRESALSASVIIPCRNEEGNIPACIDRLPPLGTHTEVIFVDGASTDGTRDRILEQIERHPELDIKLIDQVPRKDSTSESETGGNSPESTGKQVRMLRLGKGDAVRKGFSAAKGDVLFILDSDLTVPPEDLPKFLEPIATGTADFVNGTRLVYPQEDEAMMPIRYLGNKFFSLVFTWLLGQPIKDTLCGTKVLRKRDYDRVAANRAYFGDFDPFGDFDLLFGAARLGLRIAEVPVRYRARTFGYSKVKVLEHGPLLLKMSLIGFHRLKLAPWLARLRGAPLPPAT
jgi:glycosyltransferase involved in cell wall biosynthesis/SAM-dependent methyltransferase